MVRPIGRRRIIFSASVALIGWSLAMFPLMGTGSVAASAPDSSSSWPWWASPTGRSSHLPEAFPTAYRYTGTGLTYNLGGVAGGGVALVFAPMLAGSGAGTPAMGSTLP